MAKPKTNAQGFEEVLKVATKSEIGRMLDLSRQAITNWGPSIPETYAYRVSVMTGIPIEDILPEVAPDVHKRLKELANAQAKTR